MLTNAEVAKGFTPTPRTSVLKAIVRRLGDGAHDTVETATLDKNDGLIGDRWADGDRKISSQVSLIDYQIARFVSQGDIVLPGDNLLVDMDLSSDDFAPGKRLQVGSVILELSDEPHRPCKRFASRMGAAAAKFTGGKIAEVERRRGVYSTIIKSGTASVGDAVVPLREVKSSA